MMDLDWESIVNDIFTQKQTENNQQKEEIEKYLKFIEAFPEGKDIKKEITENFDSILWMYQRLSKNADTHNISWSEENKFDADLYASMVFCAYYLQKAWATVADFPPPLPVARVIGYALIVGYRLGIMGGQQDEL